MENPQKDRIEELCNDPEEPELTFLSERGPGRAEEETRSVKGLWADRIYTLRNHLIHGQEVAADEFVFQGKQHHIVASSVLFVCTVKRLVNKAREAAGDTRRFWDLVEWTSWTDENDYPPAPHEGFAVRVDHFGEIAARRGMTKDQFLSGLLDERRSV